MALTIHNKLEELGLSKNEAAVYLAVLELGEPGIGQLEEQTGLHKQLIYNAADTLQSRGLVSIHFIRQRRHFSITDPAAIEHQLREKLAFAKSVVSDLYEVANKKRVPDQTRIYRGIRGIQQYYNQFIRRQPKQSTISILGVDSQRYFEIFNPEEHAYQSFEQARLERRINLQLILSGAPEKEITLNTGRKFIDLRLLHNEHHAPMDIVIWHDRTALLFYAADPYLLDIAGQTTVEGFQHYFQALWKTAKKVL